MASHQILLQYRPLLPWIFTSVALGYAAYLTWKIRRLKEASKKQPINKAQDVFGARHEVNIDSIDRNCQVTTDDKSFETCCDHDQSDGGCCNEGTNKSLDQLPRCRRTAFAFFVNDSAKQSNLFASKQADKSLFAEFAKECAYKWKELTNEEKAYYHKLSKDDKKRYELELREYKSRIQNQVGVSNLTNESPLNTVNVSALVDVIPDVIPKEEVTEHIEPEPFRPFSANGNDIDDLAFDIFCTDEMPTVREMFAPLSRRMSGEEMLDELLKRWDMLPSNLKDGYMHKAIKSIDENFE